MKTKKPTQWIEVTNKIKDPHIPILFNGKVYFRAFLYEDDDTDKLNEKTRPVCSKCKQKVYTAEYK